MIGLMIDYYNPDVEKNKRDPKHTKKTAPSQLKKTPFRSFTGACFHPPEPDAIQHNSSALNITSAQLQVFIYCSDRVSSLFVLNCIILQGCSFNWIHLPYGIRVLFIQRTWIKISQVQLRKRGAGLSAFNVFFQFGLYNGRQAHEETQERNMTKETCDQENTWQQGIHSRGFGSKHTVFFFISWT